MNKKKVIFLTSLFIIIGIFILVIILINSKEREVYLSDIKADYYTVGYYDLSINEDHNKNKLSLKVNNEEQEFEKGFFAHAYSTIVFDDLKKYNLKKFSTYLGINETARNNGTAKMQFMIYFDQELVYKSDEINGSSEAIYIEILISNVNRITLVIDDLNGNGNDHGVWAEPLLTYKGRRVLE